MVLDRFLLLLVRLILPMELVDKIYREIIYSSRITSRWKLLQGPTLGTTLVMWKQRWKLLLSKITNSRVFRKSNSNQQIMDSKKKMSLKIRSIYKTSLFPLKLRPPLIINQNYDAMRKIEQKILRSNERLNREREMRSGKQSAQVNIICERSSVRCNKRDMMALSSFTLKRHESLT